MKIEKRLEELKEIIKTPDFLEKTMEVPFYVFEYDIEDEALVEYHLRNIKESLPFNIHIIDIFSLLIRILEEMEYLKYLFGRNQKEVFENIAPFITDVQERILNESKDADILFVIGIGKAYPFLKITDILKFLESHIRIPVIVFYPGSFDGVKFFLFDRLQDGVYYRAKPIISREWRENL